MAVLLAQLALVLLCLTGLCVLLLELPVPRIPFGVGISILIVAQVASLRAVHEDDQVYVYPPPKHGALDGSAEIIATLVVPALTTMLLTVLILYLLEARRAVIVRLERARAMRAARPPVPRA